MLERVCECVSVSVGVRVSVSVRMRVRFGLGGFACNASKPGFEAERRREHCLATSAASRAPSAKACIRKWNVGKSWNTLLVIMHAHTLPRTHRVKREREKTIHEP